MVKNSPSNPSKAVRQQTYLRALADGPNFNVHLGHFETRSKKGILITPFNCHRPQPCISGIVEISSREEKGTDVNIAAFLLKDAFLGDLEKAVVISNDSGLASAIHVVRVDAGLDIHVLSPGAGIHRDLRSAASSASLLNKLLIPQCQLPDPFTLSTGTVLRKPRAW
jgi:uncharacterized LabA/DUF88 family protein